jgi:hypothetical protein
VKSRTFGLRPNIDTKIFLIDTFEVENKHETRQDWRRWTRSPSAPPYQYEEASVILRTKVSFPASPSNDLFYPRNTPSKALVHFPPEHLTVASDARDIC